MSDHIVLQIAVCEDVHADAQLLENYINDSDIPACQHIFNSAEALMECFRPGQFHLIFLDIYMTGMQGVAAAEAIRVQDQEVIIAFTTTSPDHTLQSYRLGALRYLEKPLTQRDVRETMELAKKLLQARPSITLTTAGGGKTPFLLGQILYFEQQRHVVEIHTVNGSARTSQSVKMDMIESQLPSPPFLRCHRSYLVNLDNVQRVDRQVNAFIMKDGSRADIRRGGAGKCESALDRWRLRNAAKGMGL